MELKDTKVTLAGVSLPNPVIPASGTFGFGLELKDSLDLNLLGGISLKGTTLNPRYGNPTPRIAECEGGMINSVGLQNPGIDALVNDKVPALRSCFHNAVIANISGFSLDEYRECCRRADECEGIDIIEVNISCPNVHNGGMAFGTSAKSAAEVTAAGKQVCHKPVFIKLSPNVTDISEIGLACQDAGADGLTLVNTFLGMAVDVERKRPFLSTVTGGLSGPCIRPIAVRMVWQVAKAVKIPVVGLGGIMNGRDAMEFILAGASAVQIGTANFVHPDATIRTVEWIEDYCRRHNITDLTTLIGALNR